MSLAKDQSLTVVISGKPEDVMKARREVVSELQTQVSAPPPLFKKIFGIWQVSWRNLKTGYSSKILDITNEIMVLYAITNGQFEKIRLWEIFILCY